MSVLGSFVAIHFSNSVQIERYILYFDLHL